MQRLRADPTSPGAVVLCGGESRRMKGAKAWLPVGAERMLQRVVRLVGEAAWPIIVVAAPGQELPELAPEITVARDAVPGRGPLEGLAAGLAALPDSVELVYATATDVPFLEPRWITRLAELIGEHELAIPLIGARYHPLAALYRKHAVLPAIQGLLRAGRLRLGSLVDQVETRSVTEDELRGADPTLGTIRNVNDRDDYREALRDLGLAGDPSPSADAQDGFA